MNIAMAMYVALPMVVPMSEHFLLLTLGLVQSNGMENREILLVNLIVRVVNSQRFLSSESKYLLCSVQATRLNSLWF